MKSFQQNLLMVLALGLCALCVYQWYGQTLQRKLTEDLNQLLYQKSLAIQSYTNSIATMDRQIAQMDAQLAELRATAKTNDQLILTQNREIGRLQTAQDGLTNQVAQYKKAMDTLEAKLKEAYDGIKKQNDSMKELAAQRDEFVKKFNDTMTERNAIVTKYNALVEQVKQMQAATKQ